MSKWLEIDKYQTPYQGIFPDGCINAKQLSAILLLDDPEYGKIIGTHCVSQKIVQLTDDIVEVHLRIGRHSFTGTHHCVLWLTDKGQQIASAVYVIDNGPGRKVESYWVLPENLYMFGDKKPITNTHENGMWSLGLDGAIPATRKFIRDHYVEADNG